MYVYSKGKRKEHVVTIDKRVQLRPSFPSLQPSVGCHSHWLPLCLRAILTDVCRHYSSLGVCIGPAACSLSPSYICFCPGTAVRMEPCDVSLRTTSTSVYAWETLVRIEPCSVSLGITGLLSQCLYNSNTLNIG